jgi:hypothetical protein
MLKVYALLIQKYNFDLQDKVIATGLSQLELLEVLEVDYRVKMEKLYNRLRKYYGFDKKKFYMLQDQALMF